VGPETLTYSLTHSFTVIFTQPERWYSFDHPTEGRRLSWPRVCSTVAVLMNTTACSGVQSWRLTHRCQTFYHSLHHLDLRIHTRQSWLSHFASDTAAWRTRRNIVVLDFGPLMPLCESMKTSTKLEVHCTDIRRGLSHRHSNTYRKFGGILTCGFWDMQVDKQTNRQTCWSHYSPTYSVLNKSVCSVNCMPVVE